MDLPILYTFRRCPYAMRARMALAYAGISYELREVVLSDKPAAMLALSAKGTVPVLQLADRVIDESLDVMHWALQHHNPDDWLPEGEAETAQINTLLKLCDDDFKVWLDRYKYNNHQAAYSETEARTQCERFLAELESLLEKSSKPGYLFGKLSLADVATMPFVRQFAFVDKAWFDRSPYPHVVGWLEGFLASTVFKQIMRKYEQWQPDQERLLFEPSSF